MLGSQVRRPKNEEHTVSDHLWKFAQRDLPCIVWELCGRGRLRTQTHFSRVAFSCFNLESIPASLVHQTVYNFCNRCSRVSACDYLIYWAGSFTIRAKFIPCTLKNRSLWRKMLKYTLMEEERQMIMFWFGIFCLWSTPIFFCKKIPHAPLSDASVNKK